MIITFLSTIQIIWFVNINQYAYCKFFFLLKVQKSGHCLESVWRGRKVDNPVLYSALKCFESCLILSDIPSTTFKLNITLLLTAILILQQLTDTTKSVCLFHIILKTEVAKAPGKNFLSYIIKKCTKQVKKIKDISIYTS